MTLQEAIEARHSVRTYLSKTVPECIIDRLRKHIDECNTLSGLHIQLITNEPTAFKGISSYGRFGGVENYIVMAGRKTKETEQLVGYYGETIVLLAQTLGLNTCWVGLTYKKINNAIKLNHGEKIYCVITIGYGATQGFAHKSKSAKDISNCSEDSPNWFKNGIKAVLLTPTAMNQQKFHFELTSEKREGKHIVIAKRLFSIFGYTQIDLGIAKLHFELAAGKDNFTWG